MLIDKDLHVSIPCRSARAAVLLGRFRNCKHIGARSRWLLIPSAHPLKHKHNLVRCYAISRSGSTTSFTVVALDMM